MKFEAILEGETALGLAAHNIGGPEAALGADYLRRLGAKTGAPLVSANVRDSSGGFVAPALRVVKTGKGRIAITGVVSPALGGEAVRVTDPREAILEALKATQQSYDWLVVLAYLPEDELAELAASLPEADVVVGGPTGQSIAPRRVGPTLLASATNKGKFLARLVAPVAPREDRWRGRIVEMGPELADDAEQRENLERLHQRLAARDFSADETGLVAALPPGLPADYAMAGTASCRECHASDCRLWDQSAHAHAWETLRSRGSHVDPFCQQCHTTGYGLPGGFVSRARSAELVSVGCENCHGPSLAHARRPEAKTVFAAAEQCIRCHDRENSPAFEYATYWSRIAHGEAPEARGNAQTTGEGGG